MNEVDTVLNDGRHIEERIGDEEQQSQDAGEEGQKEEDEDEGEQEPLMIEEDMEFSKAFEVSPTLEEFDEFMAKYEQFKPATKHLRLWFEKNGTLPFPKMIEDRLMTV